MNKILLGIALILFGFFCFYVAVVADWDIVQLFGLLIPVLGITFSIVGFFEERK